MSCSIFMFHFLLLKSSNQSTLHPKYLLINTSSSALGTTLLSGSNQLLILVIGMPVNIDRYVLDSGVCNKVCNNAFYMTQIYNYFVFFNVMVFPSASNISSGSLISLIVILPPLIDTSPDNVKSIHK